MAATDKQEHWLNVVFRELPYVIPETEGLVLPSGTTAERPPLAPNLQNGLIRYNLDTNRLESFTAGSWQNILQGNEPTINTVALIANLPSVPAPIDGDLATVLDDGSGNEEIYIWNSANADLGIPLNRWRLLSTTEMNPPRVNFRNETIDYTTPGVNNVGGPAAVVYSPFVKEINVSITQAFDGGATLSIQEGGGSLLMSTAEINTALVGEYQRITPQSNNTDPTYALLSTGQIQAVLTGAPTQGQAVVYVKYVVQI